MTLALILVLFVHNFIVKGPRGLDWDILLLFLLLQVPAALAAAAGLAATHHAAHMIANVAAATMSLEASDGQGDDVVPGFQRQYARAVALQHPDVHY